MAIVEYGKRINVGDALPNKGERLPSLTVTKIFHTGSGFSGIFLAQGGGGARWSVWLVDTYGNISRTMETSDQFVAMGALQARIIGQLDAERDILSVPM